MYVFVFSDRHEKSSTALERDCIPGNKAARRLSLVDRLDRLSETSSHLESSNRFLFYIYLISSKFHAVLAY